MKKTFLTIAMIFCSLATLFATIVIDRPSGIIFVGENIGIRFDCADGNRINFYFGDGASMLNVYPNTDRFQYHFYKNPGNYILHKHLLAIVTASCLTDEYRTITVLENRTISASPDKPSVNQAVIFTATNFRTSANITWDMGDGTTYANQRNIVSHTYSKAGTYVVRAFDWNGNLTTTPVSLSLIVSPLIRGITFSPQLPRVDQPVDIRAIGFTSDLIEWNFGDGSPEQIYSTLVSHRYQSPGTFTITAEEPGMESARESKAITILPENRSLVLSTPELRADKPLTVTAVNFRDRLILWDFGDGTVVSGPATMTHIYKLPGNYLIAARDENGASAKKIQLSVNVLGISDQVNLEIAEISLDNGKYYKVVPKNSKNIKAQLKMKMRGTGIVTGYWIVDNQPYQFFNETVYQGQIKTIFTQDIPGLPVINPGMHTITIQLTRPDTETVVFPTLRYFVLPYENIISILAPLDGSIIKEDNIAKFSWEEALGGSYYQIVFANSLFPLLQDDASLKWLDCPDRFNFTPEAEIWNQIKRNQWTYWKVRAMDSSKNIMAESNIQEIKIIIPGAAVGIQKITDMDGNNVEIVNNIAVTKVDPLLVHGYLTYPGAAEYLILRIYANDNMVDQLLFRDVGKEEKRVFETSIPNQEKQSRIVFQVLKSSSPSVPIGLLELKLKKE